VELLGDSHVVGTSSKRGGRVFIVLVVIALATTGCTERVTASQVGGTWTFVGPRGESAELVLSSDGKASGKDVPDAVFSGMGPLDWTDAHTFTGTWEIHKRNQVSVDVVKMIVYGQRIESAGSISLTAHADGDSLTLREPFGDPDNGTDIVFKRK
jgi:hypothetical protein